MNVTFDPKMYEVHQAYNKHGPMIKVGHIHWDPKSHSPSYIIVCAGCGNFRVFHTDSKKDPPNAKSWHHMWHEVKANRNMMIVEFAVAAYGNGLEEVLEKYIAAVKEGKFVPHLKEAE